MAEPRTHWVLEQAKRWVTVVLIVLVLVLGFQVSRLQNSVTSLKGSVAHLQASVEKVGESSATAAAAATEAETTLEAAIAQSKGGSVDPTSVRDALDAIHRIEAAVCGGPCPER